MICHFDSPIPLRNIKKQFTGNLIPKHEDFGKGTGAGYIRCPNCFNNVGYLLVTSTDLSDLDNSLCVGWCSTSCSNCEDTIDLSKIELKDLLVNVLPYGVSHYEYDKIIMNRPENHY